MHKMSKKKVAFYTFVSDEYYYNVGTHLMTNSFKKYHPDIPLYIYRQDKVDEIMKGGLNFYNSKPTFAKLLVDKYDLVVNIDADTIVTHRLDPVLEGKYEVGAVTNFNQYENASFDNITERMYLQAGLVASRSREFWDEWEELNKDAMRYVRQENDVLNKVVYGDGTKPKYKLKIFDEDKGYMGCKSLNLEGRMYVDGDKIMLDNEIVYAYHHAKGADFPKLRFDRMGFTQEVADKLYEIGWKGVSVKIV